MLATWSDCLLQYAYVGKRVLFSPMWVGVMNLQLDLQILPHPKNSGVQPKWWMLELEYLTRLILCQLMWSQLDQACTSYSGSPRGHCLVQTLTANVQASSFVISWFTWVFGVSQLLEPFFNVLYFNCSGFFCHLWKALGLWVNKSNFLDMCRLHVELFCTGTQYCGASIDRLYSSTMCGFPNFQKTQDCTKLQNVIWNYKHITNPHSVCHPKKLKDSGN